MVKVRDFTIDQDKQDEIRLDTILNNYYSADYSSGFSGMLSGFIQWLEIFISSFTDPANAEVKMAAAGYTKEDNNRDWERDIFTDSKGNYVTDTPIYDPRTGTVVVKDSPEVLQARAADARALEYARAKDEKALSAHFKNASMNVGAATVEALGVELLSFISGAEAKNDYNIVFGGQKINLTSMTIDQVLNWQANDKNKATIKNEDGSEYKLSRAVGYLQFMPETLKEFTKKSGLKGSDLFNERNQNLLGLTLLNGCGLKEYLKGDITEKAFTTSLSGRWAGLPKDENGKSTYAGDGVNKATVGFEKLQTMVRGLKARYEEFSRGVVLKSPVDTIKFPRTSSYGLRDLDRDGIKELHRGVDYATHGGTPLLSQGKTKVVHVGAETNGSKYKGYGKMIILEHAPGIYSMYAHLQDQNNLKEGDIVENGSVFAHTGNTGKGTGTGYHLHAELWLEDTDGGFYTVDFEKAKNLNLSDPHTKRWLIDDAKSSANNKNTKAPSYTKRLSSYIEEKRAADPEGYAQRRAPSQDKLDEIKNNGTELTAAKDTKTSTQDHSMDLSTATVAP